MKHIIEADFQSELGHRILVATCVQREVSGVADSNGRCVYCNEGVAA